MTIKISSLTIPSNSNQIGECQEGMLTGEWRLTVSPPHTHANARVFILPDPPWYFLPSHTIHVPKGLNSQMLNHYLFGGGAGG